jgi:hypothetical protein
MATAGRVLPVEAPVARGLRAKVRRLAWRLHSGFRH